MEKKVAITLSAINCVVAAVVLSLILTDPQTQHSQTCNITSSDTDVDVSCSGLSLYSVPKSLPTNATQIDFQGNMLPRIINNSFSCFEQLRTLDLQNNIIKYIEEGSFHCLPKLSVLDLSYNTISLFTSSYESLPVGLFSNLKHLKEFHMVEPLAFGMNWLALSKNWSFPEMTFMHLTNLESLTLSAPPILHFGLSFSKMKHLKELTLFLDSTHQIRNDTFAVFSHHDIHTLQIDSHHKIVQVHEMSFKYFPHLRTLIFKKLQVCLRSIMESLNVFSGMNMSLIRLEGREAYLNPPECNKVLTPDDTKHLVSICVEKVYLNSYGIRFIQRGTFDQEPFSKCVRYLDLSNNLIAANKELYLELQCLPNLEYLNMKVQNTFTDSKISHLSMSSDRNGNAWNKRINVSCDGEILHINVPKKLKTLKISNLFQDISIKDCTIKVHGAENLEHLYVSNWKLHATNSRFLGVNNLSSVDYTGNFYPDFADFMLNNFPNIDTLILKEFNVGLCVTSTFRSLFSSFRKLKFLSVSDNDFLGNGLFESLRSSEMRQGLDLLVREGHGLSLDLQSRICNCECNSLTLVLWLMETDVKLTNWEYYTCTREDGVIVRMSAFAASYLKNWRKCYSRFWFVFPVSTSFLFITVLIIGVMLDKYSLRLKCIFLKWLGPRIQIPKREDFLYDIFVYYSSKDDHTWVCNTFRQKMEEERGLRLCIPDRDFVPGSCTAEEILEAIHKSWKTVVYMTDVFLEDELCSFTLSSTVHSSINEMPNRLIILYSNEIFNMPLQPIVTQLLGGDDNFMLEELEEPEQWDILYRKTLCWV